MGKKRSNGAKARKIQLWHRGRICGLCQHQVSLKPVHRPPSSQAVAEAGGGGGGGGGQIRLAYLLRGEDLTRNVQVGAIIFPLVRRKEDVSCCDEAGACWSVLERAGAGWSVPERAGACMAARAAGDRVIIDGGEVNTRPSPVLGALQHSARWSYQHCCKNTRQTLQQTRKKKLAIVEQSGMVN